jgi:hypothetical protein
LHKGNWSNPFCDIARPRRMTTPIFSAAEIRRFIDTGFLRLDDAFPRELAAATRRARRRASASARTALPPRARRRLFAGRAGHPRRMSDAGR